MAKRAAIYLRVSTDAQTTENQERALRGLRRARVTRSSRCTGMIAVRLEGRDQRPGFDAMHKDAARRRFDVVMAWSVDRLGPAFRPNRLPLQLHSLGIDLSCINRASTPRHPPARPCFK